MPCSCCGRFCCVHTCACMCCSRSVKWMLGSTEQTLDCLSPFQATGSPCAARARIRCHGYNATYNCDTDCEVVAIEYCADLTDPACEWTTCPSRKTKKVGVDFIESRSRARRIMLAFSFP